MLSERFLHWLPPKRERIGALSQFSGGIALAISILTGSTFNAFAKELSPVFSSLSLVFVSELLTLLFVLISFGLLPMLRHARRLSKEEWQALGAVGILTGVAGPLLWFKGLAETTALHAGFFARTELIFMLLFAWLLLHESLKREQIAAMFAIVAGFCVISLQGFSEPLDFHRGDFLIVIAASLYALGHIIFRKRLSHIDPGIALCARSLCAIATFFALSPFLSVPFITEARALPTSLIPVLLGFAFFSRFLNSAMFYQAIDRLPINTVSLCSSLTVVGSTIVAWLYLGELLTWHHILGGLLVISGNVLLEYIGIHPKVQHIEAHLRQKTMH